MVNDNKTQNMETPLVLFEPDWGSSLAKTIIELERLRVKKLSGSVPPYIFFQLKNIFQIVESLGSARIEGNHTTLAELVEKIIENDVIKIFPANKKNETLAFVKRGLEDFSISRSMERAHGWGVPVPGDEEQIMYVWFDALTNYITALNYAGDQKLFKKYWEQENKKERRVAHVLGKGVSRFHLVYWVGMLLSAGVKLPTEEFIHGYVTVNNEKMSKSLGNVLNPHDLVSKYGTDMLRYYLLGAVSPYQDGDFSIARFEEFYQAHLANGVGNLTSRILTMVEKYCDSKVPKEAKDIFDTKKFWQNYEKFFNEYRFDEVVKLTQELVGKCDEKISSEKPWEKAKNGEDISGLLRSGIVTPISLLSSTQNDLTES